MLEVKPTGSSKHGCRVATRHQKWPKVLNSSEAIAAAADAPFELPLAGWRYIIVTYFGSMLMTLLTVLGTI